MEKATEMGKTSAVGSLQLFLGRSFSTVILAVGTIIIGLFISEGDYGLYVVALVPATTFLLFQDWGVSTALTRYCAKYRSTNEEGQQRKIIVAGLVFEIATGTALTLMSILLANFIAYTVFGKPESAFLIVVSSINILMTAINTATGSIFVGFERMKLSSYSAVVTAITFSLISPLLVYFGYGAMGAVIGYTLSSVASSAFSLVALYLSIYRKLPHSKTNKSSIYQTLKPLLKYGIPLSIGGILGGLSSPIYSFLMASYVSNVLIGNFKIAGNFSSLLSLLILPISTVLFPAFSKLDPQKEKNLLKNLFSTSVKYTVLIVVPATMAIIVLSHPLIGTLYGNKWPDAPFFLALSSIYNFFVLIGWRSMNALLPAVGETKLLMYMNLLGLGVSIPLAFLLIPPLGIIGLIIGTQASGFPIMFIGLYFSWKRYGVKTDFLSSAKIFSASFLAALAVYAFLIFFAAAFWVQLVVGSIIFLAVYLISAPLVGAINQIDIKNLRTMFSSLGLISKLLEIPLRILERLLNTRHSHGKTKN
jgi:stage V sporulation protein B